MPRAVVHRHVEKPVHNALENFQRFMLDNPMTSLRNKMSDLNVSAYSKSPRRVKTGNPSEHTRMSMDRTERYDKSNTLPPQSAMFASEPPSSSPRVDRLAPIRKQRKDGHDLDQSSEPGLTARLMTMTSNPLSGDLRYEAGYSELQAAFERAYQKMLHEQQPSVVDTILSTAWNPAAKRSAMSRTFFKKEQDKSSSWDTRAPVYEKKTFYDSLEDTHCRRVVTNMKLKQILHKTRPQSEHLLQMRLLEERQSKESGYLKKRGKGRRSKRRGQELWVETLQRFMQTSKDQKKDEMLTRIAAQPQQGRSGAPSHHSDEAAEAEERREEGSAAAREAAEEGGMQDHWERTETDPAPTGGEPEAMAGGEEEGERRPPGSIEELKSVWMQAKEGGAIQLKALSTMIMKEENRVEAFEYIKEELESLWKLLAVPLKERKFVRASCMRQPSPTNFAHLLYQASRWVEYEQQVRRACEVIYRREILLLDLLDHMALAGPVPDETLQAKLADFYSLSHEGIEEVRRTSSEYPGNWREGVLLQDYVKKVRADVVEVSKKTQQQHRSPAEEEDVKKNEQVDIIHGKVKLAAGLVMESVHREAEEYMKLLAREVQQMHGRKVTMPPP